MRGFMRRLDHRETIFVDEYIVDLDAERAALAAGYSKSMARSKAYQWVSSGKVKPHVFEAIKKRMIDRSKRTEISQDYVLETIRETIERCKQSEPVRDKEGNPIGEYKFDSSAVLKGAELLGRHLGTWNDKLKVQGDADNPLTLVLKGIQGAAFKPVKAPIDEDEE